MLHAVYFGSQFISSYFGYVPDLNAGIEIMPEMVVAYRSIFIIIAGAFIIHWLPVNFKEKYRGWFINTPIWLKAILFVIAVFIIFQFSSSEIQPFIYFQF